MGMHHIWVPRPERPSSASTTARSTGAPFERSWHHPEPFTSVSAVTLFTASCWLTEPGKKRLSACTVISGSAPTPPLASSARAAEKSAHSGAHLRLQMDVLAHSEKYSVG